MTKREQIEKDYIAECEAAGKACALRLKKAIAKRTKAFAELDKADKDKKKKGTLPKLATGKKKGANPKARP